MRCPPLSSTMSKTLKNVTHSLIQKLHFALFFHCVLYMWHVLCLRKLKMLPSRPLRLKTISNNADFSLWSKQCGFPKLHFFRILAHCAVARMYDDTKKISQLTNSNDNIQLPWVLSKGWAQAVNFPYAFFGKEWNYLSPKNIQWTSKKPHIMHYYCNFPPFCLVI